MFKSRLALLSLAFLTATSQLLAQNKSSSGTLRFEVSFPPGVSSQALDGHVMLGISKDAKQEPRYQLKEEEAQSAQFFGLDVDGLAPGHATVIDRTTLGYPIVSLDQLPAGDYYVQAVLNIYQTFHRSDGHTVKLPPDRGEGQQWFEKPGNLMSKPEKIHLDPSVGGTVRVVLSEKIPEVKTPEDTKYIKHFRIQSKLLTDFWGTPMYLGAIVVLPEGIDEHPSAHYPLLIDHGHFPEDFKGFRTEPPTAEMKGAARIRAEAQYSSIRTGPQAGCPRC